VTEGLPEGGFERDGICDKEGSFDTVGNVVGGSDESEGPNVADGFPVGEGDGSGDSVGT